MVAKVIAYGRTRDEAIARLRRALREIDGDHRGRHDQPRLPARDPRAPGVQGRRGRHRLARPPRRVRRDGGRRTAPTPRCCRPRSSSPTTRPRPSARASTPTPAAAAPRPAAQVSRAVEVRHRGQAYRIVVSQLAPGRYRAEVDGAAVEADGRAPERPRAPHHDRRRHAPHADLPPGRRPAGRGPRRAAPHHPRRRRLRPQPAARPWSSRSRSARATRWPRATSSRSSSR